MTSSLLSSLYQQQQEEAFDSSLSLLSDSNSNSPLASAAAALVSRASTVAVATVTFVLLQALEQQQQQAETENEAASSSRISSLNYDEQSSLSSLSYGGITDESNNDHEEDSSKQQQQQQQSGAKVATPNENYFSSQRRSLRRLGDYFTSSNNDYRSLQSPKHKGTDGVTLDDMSTTMVDTQKNSTLALASTILGNIFLFFLIFGMSATVKVKSLRKQLTNKSAILTGLFMQFAIMPFLGITSCLLLRNFGLSYPMAMTLLVVTSSPGGSYSNWWCSLFNAELALSVAMTTCSSLLSLIMLPCNLFFYSWIYSVVTAAEEGETTTTKDGTSAGSAVVQSLDFGSIFLSLGIVMAAIGGGLYAGYIFDQSNPHFHMWANRFGSTSGVCLILFSIFLSSGVDGSDSKLWNQPWAFYVGVSFPCVVGLLLSNALTRYLCSRCTKVSKPETVAIAIECCYQNTGIATSVAITMFSDNKNDRAMAIAVPFFYGFIEAVVIFFYCLWAWKSNWTKAPSDEKFCTVMGKSYELDDYEEEEDENEPLSIANGGYAENIDDEQSEIMFATAHGSEHSDLVDVDAVVEGGMHRRRACSKSDTTASNIADSDMFSEEEQLKNSAAEEQQQQLPLRFRFSLSGFFGGARQNRRHERRASAAADKACNEYEDGSVASLPPTPKTAAATTSDVVKHSTLSAAACAARDRTFSGSTVTTSTSSSYHDSSAAAAAARSRLPSDATIASFATSKSGGSGTAAAARGGGDAAAPTPLAVVVDDCPAAAAESTSSPQSHDPVMTGEEDIVGTGSDGTTPRNASSISFSDAVMSPLTPDPTERNNNITTTTTARGQQQQQPNCPAAVAEEYEVVVLRQGEQQQQEPSSTARRWNPDDSDDDDDDDNYKETSLCD